MKVELLKISLFVCVLNLFTACSVDENKEYAVVESNSSSLSVELKMLNDSLNSTYEKTRDNKQSDKDTSKTTILQADVNGALAGAAAGAYVKGPWQLKAIAALGFGVIGSAAASYAESQKENFIASTGPNESPIDFNNAVYRFYKIDSVSVDSASANSPMTIPQKYVKALKTGVMHNMLLEKYTNPNVALVKNLYLTDIPFEYIQNFKTMEADYNRIVLNYSNWREIISNDSLCYVEEIVDSFMSAFSTPVSLNRPLKAVQVADSYVNFVVRRSELNDTEKEITLTGISVAVYSYMYWKNKLNW